MPFINEILTYESVSIVGLEKNTGKTECLNYVINRLKTMDVRIAITSIGVDGEQTDRVTHTPKPEIVVSKGMIFVTSEKHFLQKKLPADILDVSEQSTSLGRLVTAQALSEGKAILSGPADTAGIRRVIRKMRQFDVNTTLVDGALSRLSLASPAVTDAMILTTGAVVSANIPQLVRKTLFVKKRMDVPCVEWPLTEKLQALPQGLWAVDAQGEVRDLEIPSVFLLEKREKDIFRFGTRIYVSGAISDKLLKFLSMQKPSVELIIHDFSKVFASQEEFDRFLKNGNTIKTVTKNKLIGVTVNPISPSGITLDSDKLRTELEKALEIPVYDIRKVERPCSSNKP